MIPLQKIYKTTDNLILASASPRRRAMLADLGLGFSVQTSHVDEKVACAEEPINFVKRVSEDKAKAVAEKNSRWF